MDILKFAIQMEKDGEQYYLDQAKLFEDKALSVVFNNLAEDERRHAQIIESKLNNKNFDLVDHHTLKEAQNVFENLSDVHNEIKDIPNQLDVYRSGLEVERKSIDLYQSLLEKTEDTSEKELFAFLVKQEQEHYDVLEELIKLLNRTNDWVEDAEFGLRPEDY